MTVALAGRAPATFEIKSANLPLVALLLKSTDLAALADELKARFADIPEFFDNDPLVIDLTPLKGEGEVDFGELLHLLRGYKVMPVAVKGGTGRASLALGRMTSISRSSSLTNRVAKIKKMSSKNTTSINDVRLNMANARP